MKYERQVPVPVMYKGKHIGSNRIDLIVESKVIVELKSCDALGPVHHAQVICYLRIKKLKVALLINFNVAILHDGIKRVVLSN
jgi:GxxExxY protein